MSKTIQVKLLSAVTFNGAQVEKGETIELSAKSAESLINEGGAKRVGSNTSQEGTGGDSSPSNPTDDQKPSDDEQSSTEDATALLTKALDDKYVGKIPELKEHAKAADVQFPHDANKGEIIEAIMTAGKGEAILEK